MFSWVYTWLNFENSNYSSQTVGPKSKIPPKIKSKISWNWLIILSNACNSLTRKLWESDDTCLENQLKSNLVNLFLEGFSQFEPLCASGERAIPAPQRRQFKRHYNYYLELARVLWVTNKVSLPVFKEVNNYILLSFLSLPPLKGVSDKSWCIVWVKMKFIHLFLNI